MSHSCSLTDTWWQTAFTTELPEHRSPSYWIACWVHLPEHLSGKWRRWMGSWRTYRCGSVVWGLCKGLRKILFMNLYLVNFSIQKFDCSIYLRCKIPKVSFSNDIPVIDGCEEVYRYVYLYMDQAAAPRWDTSPNLYLSGLRVSEGLLFTPPVHLSLSLLDLIVCAFIFYLWQLKCRQRETLPCTATGMANSCIPPVKILIMSGKCFSFWGLLSCLLISSRSDLAPLLSSPSSPGPEQKSEDIRAESIKSNLFEQCPVHRHWLWRMKILHQEHLGLSLFFNFSSFSSSSHLVLFVF